jgi:hypothetical protein
LSKAEERACYKFLIESDRAKKKIICTLLTNLGLINPKVMITDEELPKLKREQKSAQKQANLSVQEVVTEVPGTMIHSECYKPFAMASSEIIPTFPDGTPLVMREDDGKMYSMFTQEQLDIMHAKVIDYESLKPKQLYVLAGRLNEGYPYKAAYQEAIFTK